MSGAGAENGVERARKSDERERSGLEKIRWSGRSRELERSGSGAVIINPFIIVIIFGRSQSAQT